MQNVPGVAVADASASQPVEQPAPLYFSVSLQKFAVLWIFTFGLYSVYWFYKHWRLIQERERLDILPAMRAIFQIFFVYALFDHVNSTARMHDLKGTIAAGPLATVFIVLSVTGGLPLPDPYWLVGFLSILALLPAQHLMNGVNARVAPQAPLNNRFTQANIVVIVIGGLLIGLAILGALVPSDPDGTPAEEESPQPQSSQPVVLGPGPCRSVTRG